MEEKKDQEDLLSRMLVLSKTRKRVKKRFPVLTFDRTTRELLGVKWQKWRGRRVPREADTRQLLLTGYLGFVVRDRAFLAWARYFRENFPGLEPNRGEASALLSEELKRRQLYDPYITGKLDLRGVLQDRFDEYRDLLEGDNFGEYDSICDRAVLRQSPLERRYLCSRCGLGFLATALFASAPYGPRLTHQLVWHDELWSIIGQTELGAFSGPDETSGHGRAGMWLRDYGQLERVTGNLLRQQTQHCKPEDLAKECDDTPLKVGKELQRARQVLGIVRRRGHQAEWWSRTQNNPCANCLSLLR